MTYLDILRVCPQMTEEDARDAVQFLQWLNNPKKATRKTVRVNLITKDEWEHTPIDLLDSRVISAIKAELTRQRREVYWNVISSKPLAKASDAVDLSTAYQVII